jgi:hypothetical protein
MFPSPFLFFCSDCSCFCPGLALDQNPPFTTCHTTEITGIHLHAESSTFKKETMVRQLILFLFSRRKTWLTIFKKFVSQLLNYEHLNRMRREFMYFMVPRIGWAFSTCWMNHWMDLRLSLSFSSLDSEELLFHHLFLGINEARFFHGPSSSRRKCAWWENLKACVALGCSGGFL